MTPARAYISLHTAPSRHCSCTSGHWPFRPNNAFWYQPNLNWALWSLPDTIFHLVSEVLPIQNRPYNAVPESPHKGSDSHLFKSSWDGPLRLDNSPFRESLFSCPWLYSLFSALYNPCGPASPSFSLSSLYLRTVWHTCHRCQIRRFSLGTCPYICSCSSTAITLTFV